MYIPDIGEVVTPVDDPCQFAPEWRSRVSGYLFSQGIERKCDFESLSKTGCIEVLVEPREPEEPELKPKRRKGRRRPSGGSDKARKASGKILKPVSPFFENPAYRIFANDKWIFRQVSLAWEKANGDNISNESIPFELANRWYFQSDRESSLRKFLEPLLLTDVSLDVVAMDITGYASMRPAIEAYERLYFNCRDDDFSLSKSMHLLTSMAMPWGPPKTYLKKYEELDDDGYVINDGRPIAKPSDIWKAMAVSLGYETLMYVWHWNDRAHGMKHNSIEHMLEVVWKTAVSHHIQGLYTGDTCPEDAAKLLSAFTSHAKFLTDKANGDGGSADNDTMTALMALLSVAAPKMRVLEKGSAGMISDNEIRERISAQQAIDKQHVSDAGKSVSVEVIDAQISDAVGG